MTPRWTFRRVKLLDSSNGNSQCKLKQRLEGHNRKPLEIFFDSKLCKKMEKEIKALLEHCGQINIEEYLVHDSKVATTNCFKSLGERNMKKAVCRRTFQKIEVHIRRHNHKRERKIMIPEGEGLSIINMLMF